MEAAEGMLPHRIGQTTLSDFYAQDVSLETIARRMAIHSPLAAITLSKHLQYEAGKQLLDIHERQDTDFMGGIHYG